MISPASLLLSLLLSLLTLLTLIPQTHAQAVTNDINVARYQCYPKLPLPTTPCADLSNCAKALLSGFPNDVSTGEFHRGGPYNVWRLPRAAFVGDCIITVDLVEGQQRTLGSWPQVWTLVNTLSSACIYYMLNAQGAPSAFTGGTVLAGRDFKLMVSVKRYPGPSGNNGTEVVAEV
ncbi:MAG: hypothetical protein Q9204_004430 [Flavoplaca sp. TL-2023a]